MALDYQMSEQALNRAVIRLTSAVLGYTSGGADVTQAPTA